MVLGRLTNRGIIMSCITINILMGIFVILCIIIIVGAIYEDVNSFPKRMKHCKRFERRRLERKRKHTSEDT